MTVRAETEITLIRSDDGVDGYSPTATVTKLGDTATITITDKNGTTSETVSDGTPGISVISVQTQYYLSTTDETPPLPDSPDWSDEQQEFESGKFYWTRDKITYSNGTVGYSTAIYAQGLTLANEYALDARNQATSAYYSASSAIDQLSVVEDIVGVLDLLTKNGDYQPTNDLAPQPDKWYFIKTGDEYNIAPAEYEYVLTTDVAIDDEKTYYTRSGSGTAEDPYVYTPVESPDVSELSTYYELENPTSLGYYELVGVQEAIQNYVSSHLVLNNQGLNLQNGKTRLLLSTTSGLSLYDQDGNVIAQYGSDVVIGSGTYKVKLTPTAMTFIEDNNPVAKITNQELAIKNTRVSNSMRMGNFVWTINTDGRLILKYSTE